MSSMKLFITQIKKKKLKFAAFRLRGQAQDWWLRVKDTQRCESKAWVKKDFLEEFKGEYIPNWTGECQKDGFQILTQKMFGYWYLYCKICQVV